MYDLLIGTRDWQNTDWAREFYPDNLPEDWRFCFYSNQFRTVLVPGTVWGSISEDEINTWIEDSDDEFKIVCELPKTLSETISISELEKLFQEFLIKTKPLENQIVACFWEPGADQINDAEFLDDAAKIISKSLPASILVTDNLISENSKASCCWVVSDTEAPEHKGEFLVTLCDEKDLKKVRIVIEKLQNWMGDTRQAALIFEGENALEQARQARMIAEMLVV